MKILVWGQDYHQLGERIDDGSRQETGVTGEEGHANHLGRRSTSTGIEGWITSDEKARREE